MAKVGDTTVRFGARGYDDFTAHKDEKRTASYLAGHTTTEDWTLSGIDTAGFWARWLLWNKPSLSISIADINRRSKSLSVGMRCW